MMELIKWLNRMKVQSISRVAIGTSFLFAGYASFAQKYEVKATLDSNIILIGDQIKLTFELEHPAGMFLNFPIFGDTIIGQVEVLEKYQTDTVSQNNNMVLLRQQYLLSSFDSGVYIIPPIPFLLTKESVKDTLFSNPLLLAVQTLKVDTANAIFDIKKPIGAPFTWAEIFQFIKENWYFFLGGFMLIAGILFLVYYYIRKMNNKPLFGKIKPELPPHIVAYDSLDKLKANKLWQRGKVKEYYTELTDIIRIYIEKRFNIMALEQTSEEILQSFKYISIVDGTLLRNLRQLLTQADLVKFAKESPLPDENELYIQNAYFFVDKTKLVAETLESTGEKEPVNIGNVSKKEVNVEN